MRDAWQTSEATETSSVSACYRRNRKLVYRRRACRSQSLSKGTSSKLSRIKPDEIVGAWEQLAEALSKETSSVTGVDKHEWAERISPHLNLDEPRSPSLRKLISGIAGELDLGAHSTALPN